ncbi:MAG: hypothetical protein AAF549_08945 [Pseudomonadota bacterium]
MNQKPVLVITNKTMPTNSGPLTPVETGPLRAPEILAQDIANAAFFDGTGTVVGQRVDQLNKDLFALNSTLSLLSDKLNGIGAEGRNLAAGYYASIATISTQLQSGTTPGNPRMVQKLDVAQSNLENLANNVADLNTLAVEIADTASRASYLLDTTRSTFNLSGAVEEDHVRLTKLEDKISASIVSIDRLLNEVNDDISRTNAYLATERNNLRTIALAVSNGDFYGGSLANNPFSQAPISDLLEFSGMPQAPAPVTQMPTTPLAVPTAMQPPNMITPPRDITLAAPAAVAPPPPASYSPRPLAKIKFDRPNVNYEQPIYAAVQEALNRFPNARFELIAVHPTTGNTAQQAIESTRARRSAEKVLRTLTQFGVPLDQIDMSYAPNPEAETSEVHLFLRS